MFNTKKENSPNGILHDDELRCFDTVLHNNLYEYIIVFLHHHPVLIGSASMDTMVIENADLLINKIKNSGKTSILNLIPRFFDPQSGEVSIDDQNIKKVSLSSLRSCIALVSLGPSLFDLTLKENFVAQLLWTLKLT